MGLVTNMEKFNAIKQKMEESQNKKGGWGDDRMIEFKPGHTYKFRLLFYKNESTEFDGPIVEKWTHGAKNSDGKYRMVTCPTTQFAKSGFDRCPICTINNKLYNSKVDSDYELYKKFRRKFNGYIPVFVIQDSAHPENEGHAKIMRFGIDIYRTLKTRIFGLEDKKSDEVFDEDLYVGWDAFDLKSGNDLIITVTKKGEWNDYRVDFSPKKKPIPAYDADVLDAELTALKFGEDIREETEEKLQEFFNECVLQHIRTDDSNETSVPTEPSALNETEVNVPSTEDLLKEIQGEIEPETPKTVTVAKTKKADVATAENGVDDLLSQIEKEVNG